MEVTVSRPLLESNEAIAAGLAETFRKARVLVLNMISSPGAGKTTLLERTLTDLGTELRFGVIEGDLQTDNDARRVATTGAKVWQINTNGGCHLDARQIRDALTHFDLEELDILIIENVGNLVCPVEFYCGEDAKIAVLSVPEGDDKPEKYPLLFNLAKAMILNKTDLLPYLDFDVERAVRFARQLNPELPVFPISCRNKEGLEPWYAWLRAAWAAKKQA